MNLLSLFSGIGGIDLAAERAGMTTVAFCECDPFCQQVLRKHWPTTRIFNDVRDLTRSELPERIDVVAGGYPCQPFSNAGKRRGAEDDRYLWPEMRRVIDETRPDWVVGENVAGHVSMGLDEVLADLESLGYTALPFVIPAASVGARHVRDRCWVVAHAGRLDGERRKSVRRPCNQQRTLHTDREEAQHDLRGWLQAAWVADDSRIRGSGNGVPNRMDRLKSIGNAVVPAQAYPIFAAIAETYNAGVKAAAEGSPATKGSEP